MAIEIILYAVALFVAMAALAAVITEYRIRSVLREYRRENAEFADFLDDWRDDAAFCIEEMGRLKDELASHTFGPN